MGILMLIIVATLGLAEDKPPNRNTGRNHEIVWQQRGFTVYRYELSVGDRTAPRLHSQPVLTIPLAGKRVLEHESSVLPLTWTMRTGIAVHPTPGSHSAFNPDHGNLINLEIEFPQSPDIILTPRFTEGIKDQFFQLPGFVLGRHVMLRGQVLTALPGCEGTLIAMSDVTLRGTKSNLMFELKTGDALSTHEDLENKNGGETGLLTICLTVSGLANNEPKKSSAQK